VDDLWPTSSPGQHPELLAETMRELRRISREGTENELGNRLYALAANPLPGGLSRRDMAIAAERPEAEVQQLIATFHEADLRCRRNATAEHLRRHPVPFA
jgi:hypothetical protein